MITLAVLFLVVLFLAKTTNIFKNKETYQSTNQENSLTYSNATIQELVNKDTDGDGILDWEEGLWGTDPTKKETTLGVSDTVAIAKLKAQNNSNEKTTKEGNLPPEALTKTDQFSRELFSTIATLNQNGVVDQETIEKLSISLTEKIRNPATRKVFHISDVKISNKESFQAYLDYNNSLNNIIIKYKMDYTVLDVLQKFIVDENNVDMTVLAKLDPIISKTTKIIQEMTKTTVPQSLSGLHLDFINTLQRLVENMTDIKLFDSDIIVALSGISQYQINTNVLESTVKNLGDTINQKLNN